MTATTRLPDTHERITAASQLDIEAIWEAQVSPDGRRVAYVVRTSDRGADVNRTAIWLAEEDEATGTWETRRLTSGSDSVGDLRWSPDGPGLAFVSDRSGSGQVHVFDMAGGEPRQLTRLAAGASSPSWSPDGTRIAVVSLDRAIQEVPEDPLIRRVRRLPYRTPGGGWVLDRFNHIWIVDMADGDATQLTFGPWNDGPAAWSPDGTRIAFASVRSMDTVVSSSKGAVYVIDAAPADPDADGRDAARVVSDGLEGAHGPAWSPDGTRIACVGTAPGQTLNSDPGIWVVPADGGAAPERADEPSTLAIGSNPELDVVLIPPLSPTWSDDGTSIWFGACDAGRQGLYRVDPATHGATLVVGGERAIAHVSFAAGDRRLCFMANDWTSAGDLFVAGPSGDDERRITDLGAAFVERYGGVVPDLQRVPTADGRFVLDTWLFRPSGAEPGRRHPMVQLVHGGPDGTFGPAYLFVVQQLAAAGFAVQLVNCRGGLSYGSEFDAALGAHYGENDERDFWDAIDAAVASGGIDPVRVGIFGHSYGGFMAAWMPGRTDRYKAAVASAIMANFVTQALTAFYGDTHGWTAGYGGKWPDLWAEPAEWWRRSPIAYVPTVTAPILLLMGEEDRITTPSEHEQLFSALLARGKVAEMVRFVSADHTVSSSGTPRVRTERSGMIVGWFERHLVTDEGEAGATA